MYGARRVHAYILEMYLTMIRVERLTNSVGMVLQDLSGRL